jgi:hypothetical protein
MIELQFWFPNCIVDTIVQEARHGPSNKACAEIARSEVKSFYPMSIVYRASPKISGRGSWPANQPSILASHILVSRHSSPTYEL